MEALIFIKPDNLRLLGNRDHWDGHSRNLHLCHVLVSMVIFPHGQDLLRYVFASQIVSVSAVFVVDYGGTSLA